MLSVFFVICIVLVSVLAVLLELTVSWLIGLCFRNGPLAGGVADACFDGVACACVGFDAGWFAVVCAGKDGGADAIVNAVGFGDSGGAGGVGDDDDNDDDDDDDDDAKAA